MPIVMVLSSAASADPARPGRAMMAANAQSSPVFFMRSLSLFAAARGFASGTAPQAHGTGCGARAAIARRGDLGTPEAARSRRPPYYHRPVSAEQPSSSARASGAAQAVEQALQDVGGGDLVDDLRAALPGEVGG